MRPTLYLDGDRPCLLYTSDGIGFGASVALDGYQRTADSAYVGSGARPDPEPKLRGIDPQKKS